MTAFTLETVHEEIGRIYAWWAKEQPGVTPKEVGYLAHLWAIADRLAEEEEERERTGV